MSARASKGPSSRIWPLASAIWLLGTGLSSILAAVILDTLMHRPEGGGSVTTVIPGFVYAIATVMKVCLVFGVLSAGIAVVRFATRGRSSESIGVPAFPVWGILSVVLTASTPLLGALAVILVQTTATDAAT